MEAVDLAVGSCIMEGQEQRYEEQAPGGRSIGAMPKLLAVDSVHFSHLETVRVVKLPSLEGGLLTLLALNATACGKESGGVVCAASNKHHTASWRHLALQPHNSL